MKMVNYDEVKKKFGVIEEREYYGYVFYRTRDDGRTKWKRRYRLVLAFLEIDIPYKFHVHHIDFDKKNDQPENLRILSRKEHCEIHGKIFSEKGNGGSSRMLGKKHSEETKRKIALGLIGNNNSPMFRSEEYRLKAKIRQGGLNNSNARKDISISEVVRLHSLGYSKRRIARELNCSTVCVRNRLKETKEHGIPVDSLAPSVMEDEKIG